MAMSFAMGADFMEVCQMTFRMKKLMSFSRTVVPMDPPANVCQALPAH